MFDYRPFNTPNERAWTFRTVGKGHGAKFWGSFLSALRDIGYDDVLSIENEDPSQTAEEGVARPPASPGPSCPIWCSQPAPDLREPTGDLWCPIGAGSQPV